MFMLRTQQLRLCCPSPLDAVEFLSLVKDSEESLAKWSDFPTDGLTPERVATYLRRRRSAFDLDKHYFYLVRVHATEMLVGVVELRFDTADGVARLAGWAHPSVEGNGYAMEGVLGLLRAAFASGRMSRVEYRCEPDNERSVALARRLGLVHEATLRGSTTRGGLRRDEMLFALVADDVATSAVAEARVRAWDALGRVVLDDLRAGPAISAHSEMWAQLAAQLRTLAPMDQASQAPHAALTVAMRCTSPDGELVQPVTLELADSPMGPWVVIRTIVPFRAALAERLALEHNATLAYGALCIEGGNFVMRHAGPLAGFVLGDITRVVSALAQEAVRLGSHASRTTFDVAAFAQYND
jgi:RimJ/RimL family protein N-acetyltransferase